MKIHQITYVIFETIYQSFFTTQFLCIFLAQTLHTIYKSSPSKYKFSDFPLLGSRFTKFLMLFFKQKVSFSSKFGSLVSVMRKSFCTFLAETLYVLEKSNTSKCKQWQWRKMQNLKRNWLVQNWHEEFNKFWPKHSKISKICTLMDCLWPKYIMSDLKKYKRVMFYSTEYCCKIWRKTDFCFQKWHKEFVKFSPEHLKVSKSGLWWDSFIYSTKCMNSKCTRGLFVMTMKIDARLEEELTCCFKTDIRSLTNFDLSTWISQKNSL